MDVLQNGLTDEQVEQLGRDIVEHNIQTWSLMIKVLESGEHCPHHIRGRKP